MVTSNTSIRNENFKLILKHISENQPISRAKLSANTGLNKASVSDIVRVLIEQSYILEVGSGESTDVGGRRPILLSFNKNAGIVLGIDVGVNSIRYMVSTLDGNILKRDNIRVTKEDEYSNLINKIIQNITKESSESIYGIISATISIQGAVFNNKIIFTPNYNVIDLELLNNFYNFPIYFENEANLAALSQSNLHQEHDVAAISIGSGIGAGIVFNKEIYTGNEGSAGELGHTIVLPFGRNCPCGNQGCLERYTSESAIVNEIRKNKKDPSLSIYDYINLIKSYDPQAIALFDENVKFLSIGIANFLTLYDLPKIYLVSTLSSEIPEMVNMIQKEMKGIFNSQREILNSSLGKFSSSHGACIYSINKFIEQY